MCQCLVLGYGGLSMKRREFIAAVSSGVVWPLAAWAQDRVRRVGVLVPLPVTDAVFRRNIGAFTAAMKDAGWIEGRNLETRIVSIMGSGKTPADAAADAIALSADVILAITPVAAEALHRQTSANPVVFVVGFFSPVEKGFAAAINKPGGNMTGIDWAQLLKQMDPNISRVGIVSNPDEGTIPAQLLQMIKESAGGVAIGVADLPIRNEAEIENVVSNFAADPNGGLIFLSDIFTAAHRARIIAATKCSPYSSDLSVSILCSRWRAGSVQPRPTKRISSSCLHFGPHSAWREAWRSSGPNAKQIRACHQSQTAKALGLTIPPAMLSVADELIG
jgi:putative tryptophan/tyrosine transport system substrate-binding protein